jgi:hypothetical protein
MTDVTISSTLGEIEKYKFNPVMIQRTALEALRKVSDGTINITDPTSPFVFCLENSATNTAAFMQQNEATTRRLYPAAAIDAEDLYLHMSDKDYVNRFAVPATAKFTVMLSKEELLTKLVLDTATGIKKITIPRNTIFTVADTNFSLQYPIDIRLLSHGGLQIVFIADKLSPLLTLPTNLIDWDTVRDPTGLEFVRFNVDAFQFDIVTSYNDISASSGFKTDVAISDSFYFVRCYIQDTFGVYNEILTTHTQQIYDPLTPTAVVKVLEGKVRIVIPVIYTTTGIVRGKLRVDVYQTKGALRMLLGNYKLEDYSANWINVDPVDDTIFCTPIRNFKTLAIFSTSEVDSGRDALTFEQLKLRVIKNAIGTQSLPITNVQLLSSLEDGGYQVVRNIDTITNRAFLATRSLPKPVDDKIITAAASSMSTVTLTLQDAVGCYGVIDNNTSVTLTSKVVYQTVNGITKPLTTLSYNHVNSLATLLKCTEVTNGNYFYSPFHYVLDASGITFEVRPYYLDSPTIESKSFVAENPTTGLQVSIDASYSVVKTDTGYLLNVVTKSSDTFKAVDDTNIFVQLAFNSRNESVTSYLLGTLMGKDVNTNERLYQFNITSNFDIDLNDFLTVTSFQDNASAVKIQTSLLQEMDIFFTTTAPMDINYRTSTIDDVLGKFQLPPNVVAITNEKIKLRFGYSLNNLWARSRSVVSSVPYQTYATDIPALYRADVYQVDSVTGSAFTVDVNGNLVYTILHHKNDPILDTTGNPVFSHLKNEIKYDYNGDPIPVVGYTRQMVRNIDIMMIEGAYYFATDSVVAAYKSSFITALLSWLTVDLVKYNSALLDKTKVYFHPNVTLGDIKVTTINGLIVTIPAGQAIKVVITVPAITYNDANLLNAIKKTTVSVIDTALKNITIATSAIESALRTAYGNDVIDVELTGLGGVQSYSTFSMVDNSTRCSIRKKLNSLPDESLIVSEDVEIEIVLHDLVTI